MNEPENEADDGGLDAEENHANADEIAATEPGERAENEENLTLLSDWTRGARGSKKLEVRDPEPNFGLFIVHSDERNVLSNARNDKRNVSLAAAHTGDVKPAEMSLAAFEQKHAVGMSLFQQSLGPSIGACNEKLKELNTSFDKSSFRDRVEELVATDNPMPLQHHLAGVLLNQTSTNKGIAKHGDGAREALFTEFLQLCSMETLVLMHRKDLIKQQRKSSLRATSVIKEKRDGILKGRTCAFGKYQRGLCEKHETSSATVHAD